MALPAYSAARCLGGSAVDGGIVLAPAGILVGFVRVASRGGKRAACDRGLAGLVGNASHGENWPVSGR